MTWIDKKHELNINLPAVRGTKRDKRQWKHGGHIYSIGLFDLNKHCTDRSVYDIKEPHEESLRTYEQVYVCFSRSLISFIHL